MKRHELSLWLQPISSTNIAQPPCYCMHKSILHSVGSLKTKRILYVVPATVHKRARIRKNVFNITLWLTSTSQEAPFLSRCCILFRFILFLPMSTNAPIWIKTTQSARFSSISDLNLLSKLTRTDGLWVRIPLISKFIQISSFLSNKIKSI